MSRMRPQRHIKLHSQSVTTGLLWALLGALTGSCSAADYGDIKPIAVDVDAVNPTWENGIGQLVAKKCDNCHAKTPSKFVPGEIRDNPKRYQIGLASSEDSFLSYGALSYKRVFETLDDPMPPKYGTPLNATEKQALQAYLKKWGYGAEPAAGERATFLTETCANVGANSLTYANDVSSFASATCLACHGSGPSPIGGLTLASAADWKANREALVWVLAKDGAGANPMPAGREAGYTAAGKPGETPLRYLCGSAEITASL